MCVAVADAIRSAVAGSRSVEAFEARARATPRAELQVVVQHVDPFGPDGETADGQEIDASFVAAAFGLRAASPVSDVVETRFGWHVIYLIDRFPSRPADNSRESKLSTAVQNLRARAWLESQLRRRRKASRVEVASGAEGLMAEVRVP